VPHPWEIRCYNLNVTRRAMTYFIFCPVSESLVTETKGSPIGFNIVESKAVLRSRIILMRFWLRWLQLWRLQLRWLQLWRLQLRWLQLRRLRLIPLYVPSQLFFKQAKVNIRVGTVFLLISFDINWCEAE
jgi:hypothetical protein